MKTERKLTLKFFATLLAFLFTVGGVFGQEAEDFGNANADDNISYITVGRTMPFYVKPDEYYHPDFEPVSDNITEGFTWIWAPVAEAWDWGTELTLADEDLNYVEITAGDETGDFDLNVREQAPEEFGGCEDPEGTDITIRVVEAPEIHSFPSFQEVFEIGEGETYQQCGDVTGFDASIELSGFPNFEVRWELVIETYNEETENWDEHQVITDETAVGPGTSYSRLTNETYDFDSNRDLVVENNRRTRYTYTIEGITDLISRRSDYLDGETTWYDTVERTFAIIVNPAPETGPIFHIPEGHGEL